MRGRIYTMKDRERKRKRCRKKSDSNEFHVMNIFELSHTSNMYIWRRGLFKISKERD